VIGAVDIALAALLGLLGLACALLAIASLGPVTRLWREGTTRIGDIREGPVEVVGTIHAMETPLKSWDDANAVLVRRNFGVRERSGGKTHEAADVHQSVQVVAAEVRDGGAACPTDLSTLVLFGEHARWGQDADAFAQAHPDDWAAITSRRSAASIQRVTVDETWLPDGARCLVSATACKADAIAPGGDYRSATQSLHLATVPGRAMIVAAGTEREVRNVLMRRTWRLALLAGTCWLVGAMAISALGSLERLVR